MKYELVTDEMIGAKVPDGYIFAEKVGWLKPVSESGDEVMYLVVPKEEEPTTGFPLEYIYNARIDKWLRPVQKSSLLTELQEARKEVERLTKAEQAAFRNWFSLQQPQPSPEQVKQLAEGILEDELNFVHASSRNHDFDLGFRTGFARAAAKLYQSKPMEVEGEVRYNSILPISQEPLLKDYVTIREPNEKRDKDWSPLFDAVMNTLARQLELYFDKDVFMKVWTSSLFPERLSKAILRLVEQYLKAQPPPPSTQEDINSK